MKKSTIAFIVAAVRIDVAHSSILSKSFCYKNERSY